MEQRIEVEYRREGTRHRTALVVREHPPKTWKGTPPAGLPAADVRPLNSRRGRVEASCSFEPMFVERVRAALNYDRCGP